MPKYQQGNNPDSIVYRKQRWDFDSIGGTNEPIYYRVTDKGVRLHLLIVRATNAKR